MPPSTPPFPPPLPPVLPPWQVVPVPGAYLEFVERKPLAAAAGLPRERLRERQRRDGFEAASANHIFASTTLAAERAAAAAGGGPGHAH
jgi:hypothetical protein